MISRSFAISDPRMSKATIPIIVALVTLSAALLVHAHSESTYLAVDLLDGNPGVDRAFGDLPGMPLPMEVAAVPRDCATLCQQRSDCVAWAFGIPNCGGSSGKESLCWLKKNATKPSRNTCRVSGRRVTGSGLLEYELKPIPQRNISPEGWIFAELLVQADGLSGHLAQFWPDVQQSYWVGGTVDETGGLHESVPYWLNGFLPLVGFVGDYRDNLAPQAKQYIEYILDHQQDDGWLGPTDNRNPWSRFPLLLSLLQWLDSSAVAPPSPSQSQSQSPSQSSTDSTAQRQPGNRDSTTIPKPASGDSDEYTDYTRILSSVVRFVDCLFWQMLDDPSGTLPDWAAARWMDLALALQQLYPIVVPDGASMMAESSDFTPANGRRFVGYRDDVRNRFAASASSATLRTKPTRVRLQGGAVHSSAASGPASQSQDTRTIPTERGSVDPLAQWLRAVNLTLPPQRLLDMMEMARSQGLDWESWFSGSDFPRGPVQSGFNMFTHGVNNAQAVKSAAVSAKFMAAEGADGGGGSSGSVRPDEDRDENVWIRFTKDRISKLNLFHGQSSGIFGADEHLAGSHPSRGTELCTVVEMLFSMEVMMAQFGLSAGSDAIAWADQIERIAYNAFPAAFQWNMWSHQYLQQANQMQARPVDDHIWATDGPDSVRFGLSPNFECCTANFNQGWPKLLSTIYALAPSSAPSSSPDEDITVVLFGPSSVRVTKSDGVSVSIHQDTQYPFDEAVSLSLDCSTTISSTSGLGGLGGLGGSLVQHLRVRIPQWVGSRAFALVNDTQIPLQPGSWARWTVPCDPSGFVRIFLDPRLTLQRRFQNAAALSWGAVQFSLAVDAQVSVDHEYAFESRDYSMVPSSQWAYALRVCNDSDLARSNITVVRHCSASDAGRLVDQFPALSDAELTRVDWRPLWLQSALASSRTIGPHEPRNPVVYRCSQSAIARARRSVDGRQGHHLKGSSVAGSPCPFDPDHVTVWVEADGYVLPTWTLEHNAPSAPPVSPVTVSTSRDRIRMIPYGAANLRITELPSTCA